jgi:hypothetical protein
MEELNEEIQKLKHSIININEEIQKINIEIEINKNSYNDDATIIYSLYLIIAFLIYNIL